MADVDAILNTIRQTESGGNYTARNGSSSASGAYQFINSTWKGLGGSTRTAAEASEDEQNAIARKYVESILAANNDDPRAVFKTWYVGNANAAEDYIPNPEAGNHLTVGQYADLQMKRLGQGGSTDMTEPTGTPEEVASQLYGYLASYLTDPEIGPILKQAAAEQWSSDRLQGALYQTAWWTATNNAAKQWGALETSNPTEAESQVGSRIAELQDMAQQNGFSLSDPGLRDVAENSLKYGWNQAQIQNALGAEVLKRPGDLQTLRTSTLAGKLKQTKSDYGIPLSDQALDQWTQDVVSGKRTEDDFNTYVQGVAKSLYPSIAAALDAGATTSQVYDPYKQIASQTLGVAPDSVDLSDPKWSSALSVDNGKGQKMAMGLDQWQAQLKSNPIYKYGQTQAGRAEAYATAKAIEQKMGVG